MARSFDTKTYLALMIGTLFFFMSVVVVLLVNSYMKRFALMDAESAARMSLDHNLAVHTYFSKDLKPKLFDHFDQAVLSKDYFDPVWMSSTFAVRKMDQYFHEFNQNPYYYKECAINARSAENEADDYEQAFILELQNNPDLVSKSKVRTLNDEPYFTLLRRGESMESSCLRCHSSPDKAPRDLVAQYGPERSFNRKVDEVTQAISIRIPLSEAYAGANRFSVYLSGLLLVIFGGGLLGIWSGNKKLIINPLTQIRDQAVRITSQQDNLGQTIPEPKVRELGDLVSAFNQMSVELKKTYDNQEQEILDRTKKLSEANRQLKLEIQERNKAESALRESEEKYRLLFEKGKDSVVVYETEAMKLIDANPAAEDLWGYSKSELLEKTPADLFFHTPVDVASGPKENELPIQWRAKKDGTSIAVEVSSSHPFTWKGENCLCSIIRDVTHQEYTKEMLSARMLQQVVVADLGQSALSGKDLKSLMDEAVLKVSRTLGVDYTKILEISPEEDLLLVAGVGWRDGVVGNITVATGADSQAGYTLLSREPVVVEDLRSESRFSGPTLLVEHEVVSGVSVIIQGNGRPYGILGVHTKTFRKFTEHDVTFLQSIANILAQVIERKKVEQSLAEAEELFRTAFENANIGLCILDIRGRFLRANNQICRIWGFSRSEIENMSIQDITHPDDSEITPRFMERALSRKTDTDQFEERYIHKNGTIVLGKVSISLVRDRNRDPMYFVSHVQDITQVRNAEIDRERLVSAVEQAAEAVVITDSQARILYVNPAFEKITGYSKDESIGRNPKFLKSGKQEASFYAQMWSVIRGGDTWSGRLTNRKKDGSLYHEDSTISPIRNTSGEIVNYVAVKRDITEHLELSNQLYQSQKMEAVGTLAGGIAHDFNNILQVVLGYSELILTDTMLPNRFRSDIERINQSARNGADLVKMLLTFSKKTEIRPLQINLNRRIEQLQKMLSRTLPKNIEIELILSDDIALINADPTQVDQILMNLAVNARDAMPNGGRLLVETQNVFLGHDYVRTHIEAKRGDYVLLTVSDSGKGMDKTTIQHIFEPFFTTKGSGEGTGLGLATVYGIVQQHDGYIVCYSEPEVGTSFKIYFPAITAQDEWNTVIETPSIRGGSETILVVDDEEFIRDLATRVLSDAGYTVMNAVNGTDALQQYRNHSDHISLVVLDLIMPEMDGKRCLAELLKINPEIKVVVASGYSANGHTKSALELGARGFVSKPFDLTEFLQTIRSVIDENH